MRAELVGRLANRIDGGKMALLGSVGAAIAAVDQRLLEFDLVIEGRIVGCSPRRFRKAPHIRSGITPNCPRPKRGLSFFRCRLNVGLTFVSMTRNFSPSETGAAHGSFEALFSGGVRCGSDDVRRRLPAAPTFAAATPPLDAVLYVYKHA